MFQSLTAVAPPESQPALTPAVMDWIKIVAALVIVWAMPNSFQIFANTKPALGEIPEAPLGWLKWRASLAWAAVMAIAVAWALVPNKTPLSFLYFQF
jgi:hypothetical protein